MMKGYKTVIVNGLLVALAPIMAKALEHASPDAIVNMLGINSMTGKEVATALAVAGIAIANILLRALTTTAIGKK